MESLNLLALVAGLAGTTAMIAVLEILTLTHAVEGDLPRALGAILMRREKRTLLVGLVVHYAFGLCFGVIYTSLVMLAEPETNAALLLLCAGFAVVHGVFSTLAMIGFSERHPSPKFRERPVPAALAHGVAHLAYGLALAAVLIGCGSCLPQEF